MEGYLCLDIMGLFSVSDVKYEECTSSCVCSCKGPKSGGNEDIFWLVLTLLKDFKGLFEGKDVVFRLGSELRG